MQTFLRLGLLIKFINFQFGWEEQIQETLNVLKDTEKFHLKIIIQKKKKVKDYNQFCLQHKTQNMKQEAWFNLPANLSQSTITN